MDYNPIAPAVRDVLTAIRHRKRVDEIVELILDRSCQLCNAVHGSFITVDETTQRLIITSTHGEDWTLEKQACSLRIGEGVTGKVAKTGIPYLCGDVTKDSSYYPLFDYVRSELVVPVFVADKIWGIINMDGLTANAFDENTLATITVFAELAAFAITLRIELNEQERLQRHLIQSEKLASLGEIIAGIAHEINNPLTSILTNASLLTLKRGGERDDHSVKSIVAESRRCAELVKNLLSFSREQSDSREITGINEVIAQVCAMKKYQLKVNNVRLLIETDAVSYPVQVISAQIQQVLLNLINNAEHAIPASRQDGQIRLNVKREGERIQVRIIDNGSGIPADIQRYIFDPFFTTKPVGEGTGLGLSIARTIAETHGGNLSVESSSAAGTVFCLELPLAMSPETPPATGRTEASLVPPDSPNGQPLSPRGRILLIDDEPLILESLTDFLSMQSIQVTTFNDSRMALDLLNRESFDVIVSDIRMPGLDGMQFYEQARRINKRYARQFIFMSGDLIRESSKSFVKTTGCVCLEKPFSMETLFKNISPFLQPHGAN